MTSIIDKERKRIIKVANNIITNNIKAAISWVINDLAGSSFYVRVFSNVFQVFRKNVSYKYDKRIIWE